MVKKRKGQVMVGVVLILPVILVVIFSIFDVIRGYTAKMVCEKIAYAAAISAADIDRSHFMQTGERRNNPNAKEQVKMVVDANNANNPYQYQIKNIIVGKDGKPGAVQVDLTSKLKPLFMDNGDFEINCKGEAIPKLKQI